MFDDTKPLFCIILVFRIITVWLLENKVVKPILKQKGYSDIDENKLPQGNKTRQWNIASVLIMIELVLHVILNYVPLTKCEDIMNYDINKASTALTLFLSYLAYDLIFHKLTLIFYVHHFLAFLTVLIVYLTNNTCGIYIAMVCLLTEISTIPLGIIHITSGKVKTFWMMVFSIAFFFARPVYMLYVLSIVHRCLVYEYSYMLSYLGLTLLYILNVYWFIELVKKICRTICGKKTDKLE